MFLLFLSTLYSLPYFIKLLHFISSALGLIATDWGGTPVEAWSSPDALSMCSEKPKTTPPKGSLQNQDSPSALWNAMIYPFLNMTVKGAAWYQGEANAANIGSSIVRGSRALLNVLYCVCFHKQKFRSFRTSQCTVK